MLNAPNQVRVVEPEQDKRLALVAEAIVRAGFPDALAPILAEGFIARLRRRVWAALDDVLGTGDDLEALAGWKGPQRSLSAAIVRAGYCREVNGLLVMTDAVQEAPEYLKKRWQRTNRDGYDAAVRRCAQPNVVNRRFAEPGDDDDYDYEGEMAKEQELEQGLFGPTSERPGEKDNAKPGHKETVAHFHAAFEAAYGYAYDWRGRDFKHVGQCLDTIGDVAELQRIIDAYLADKTDYYAGHEWRVLWRDLAKFKAIARRRRGQSGRGAASNPALRTGGNAASAFL